jgi:DNA-binding NarL/FixJ family response regulator
MGRVLALTDDLIFQAKLLETARLAGIELRAVTSAGALSDEARKRPALIVVDLNARSEPISAIQMLRAAGNAAPVVGFFSHVHTGLAQRALAAGCCEVMPRSEFTRNLAAILSAAKD